MERVCGDDVLLCTRVAPFYVPFQFLSVPRARLLALVLRGAVVCWFRRNGASVISSTDPNAVTPSEFCRPKSNAAVFFHLVNTLEHGRGWHCLPTACLESDAVASLESGMDPQSSDKGP